MTEAQIEQKLGKQIKNKGGLYYKFVSPGSTGVPDRVVIAPGGKVIFIELKTESGKLSTMQAIQISRLKAVGADVRVVCGVEQAKAFVEEVFGK